MILFGVNQHILSYTIENFKRALAMKIEMYLGIIAIACITMAINTAH